MKPLVFLPEKIAASGMDLLHGECRVVAPWAERGSGDGALPTDADAFIVRLFRIGKPELARAPGLKTIAKHGVGTDNIDVEAATARKIPVLFTPAANANAVAEHTIALMMALARWIAPALAALREGRFRDRGRFEGIELAGRTLGVVGLGRIGSRVAEIAAKGLGMRVLAYDPMLSPGTLRPPAERIDSLDTLLREADFLSLHVPLLPSTFHMIGAEALSRLKPGCRIVNTSRGTVIDEAALTAALHAGTVAGAALDVFEVEPLPSNHPPCSAPNTLLTPHISSSTEESLSRMASDAAAGVLDVLAGRRPQFPVNPEVLA